MVENFNWKIGSPPPKIAPHSDRKLLVIERYLEVYFETVARDPRIDNLKITIVDGFCGGGVYDQGGCDRDGSPMALLRGVFEASVRLNQNRRKPFKIDATFHFSDDNRDHLEYLTEVISKSQFSEKLGTSIHIRHGKFETLLPSIIDEIKTRQTKGRSLFILDQFGYKDVPMASVKRIFSNLDRAEAILTFSIDALLNYLQVDKEPLQQLAQFGVDERFLQKWAEWKTNESQGRALAQRALMAQIHRQSGAQFFTPFMLFSENDNRWMMIAHLSQNQAARDKMLGVHWEQQNRFRHIGRGSHFELGYDARVSEEPALFSFTDLQHKLLHDELQNELPVILHQMVGPQGTTIEDFLTRVGNNTAATNFDLFSLLSGLSREKEIQVVSSKGVMKGPGTKVALGDTIIRPPQPQFFSRIWKN